MFTFEFEFYLNEDVDLLSFVDDEVNAFLATLNRNGQLISQHWNLIQDNGLLKLYVIAPAEDSLDLKYFHKDCHEALELLILKSTQAPSFKVLGPTVGLSECCSCADPSNFVLFTNFVAEYPPVSCGDCNLPVPLYKLPKLNNEPEYSSLLHWESEYQACDTLFINSWVGEKFGYDQISQVNSILSLEGLKICQQMALKTGKPFYYFLHQHYDAPGDNCPICGQHWKLDKLLFNLYAYKCDKCRLLADMP